MRKLYLVLLVFGLLLISCEDETEVVRADPTETVALKNPINDFTWKAMNSWYNWQTEVSNLKDSKQNNKNKYNSYLNLFESPADLFETLTYKKGEVDRFSWFIDDYEEQEKSFQGVSKSWGMMPAVVEIDGLAPMLLIKKVSKDSPASKAGLKRGDFIIGFNGVRFKTQNFNNLVQTYYNETAEFIIGTKKGIETKKVSLAQEEVADNAIHLTKVLEADGKKVGYFVYNGFRSSYDKDLNAAFTEFKTASIQDLILDLRYNGGGSVMSCTYLASMIYGEGKAEQDIFAKTIWNNKHPKQGYEMPFLKGIRTYDADRNYIEGGDIPLNRLTGIETLYVITSHNTASASEMIINGLRPYMNVVTVGETTYGKNVGSITLYDSSESDYTDRNTANKNHKNAMQPITFQIFNKNGESDYTKGFAPDIEVKESETKNLDGFLTFGDENETILKTILNKIKGVSGRPVYSNSKIVLSFKNLEKTKRFENEMYFESEFVKNLK